MRRRKLATKEEGENYGRNYPCYEKGKNAKGVSRQEKNANTRKIVKNL